MGFFVVLSDQIQARGEEGVNVHDSLKKVAIQLVLEQVSRLLQDALVLSFDLLVDLHGQVLDVILQVANAPVQTREPLLMYAHLLLAYGGWTEHLVDHFGKRRAWMHSRCRDNF